MEDEEAFARFLEAKLCFLPPDIAAKFRRRFSFDEDLKSSQRQLTLPADQIEPIQTSRQKFRVGLRKQRSFLKQRPNESRNILNKNSWHCALPCRAQLQIMSGSFEEN
jgi:hypothetical protein